MDQSRLPFGVALQRYSPLAGIGGRGTARANSRPGDAYWRMNQAMALGLSGEEFPPEGSFPADEEWRTPCERQAAPQAQGTYELDAKGQSVRFLRTLMRRG
jgi:hypothetical protein